MDKLDSSPGQTLYKYPCSSTFTIGLTFAGSNKVYDINLKDFNLGIAGSETGDRSFCVGGIMGQDMPDQEGKSFGIIGGLSIIQCRESY